jgi:hypothetical protein
MKDEDVLGLVGEECGAPPVTVEKNGLQYKL